MSSRGSDGEGHNLLPPPTHVHNSVGKSPSKVSLEALLLEDPVSNPTTPVKGRSTLRDPICFFPLCAISQGLCSLSVPGKQEPAELHTVLRTEDREEGPLLGFPSVTLLGDLVLKGLVKFHSF